MEDGVPLLQASLQGARELGGPIIAMTVILIAVYVPIGFMGGLTGHCSPSLLTRLLGRVHLGDHRAYSVPRDVLSFSQDIRPERAAPLR